MQTPTQDTDVRPTTRRLFFTGTVMGAADLVPGVSGGTMALVMGIYEEFISAIASFDAAAIRSLVTLRWKELRSVHWWLIIPLAVGMVAAFVILSGPIVAMLGNPTQRIWLFSAFFGLVLASALVLMRRLRHGIVMLALELAGAAFALVIVQLVPIEGSGSMVSLFLSGMIAINAMILPGISGSFMLLILGEYEHVISGIRSLDLLTLLSFGSGAAIGLFSFVRLLRWVLARWHDQTMAILAGFLIGSLWKLWPWRLCTDSLASECVREQLIAAPSAAQLGLGILLAIIGFGLVVGADRWHRTTS